MSKRPGERKNPQPHKAIEINALRFTPHTKKGIYSDTRERVAKKVSTEKNKMLKTNSQRAKEQEIRMAREKNMINYFLITFGNLCSLINIIIIRKEPWPDQAC